MLIRPDQKKLPAGQGQSTEPGHLAWRLLGARAHMNQQERRQRELRAERQAATHRERARRCGHWVLGTEAGSRDPQTSGAAQPLIPPCLQTSAARMRRNCSAEGKTGRPRRCHSP